jgi:PST family polysaccharide transporter
MRLFRILHFTKKKLQNSDTKVLVQNFFSLSVLNALNYIFPIVLVPYLTRKLGVEKYGLYIFAFSIINYFVLIVRFGFDFSATKQVALNRNDREKLNELFSSILVIRLMLSFLSFAIILALIQFIPKFSEDKVLYFYGIGIFFGISLTPTWFFLGMEKMKFITIINFFIRIVLVGLVVIFIKDANDYRLVLLFNSISFFLGGILSLLISFKIFRINFIYPSFRVIKYHFLDGWHLFLSTIGVNFYRESNVIILGFIAGYKYVGIYAAAEKLIKAIQSLTIPIVNTLFPYFGRKLSDGNKASEFLRFNKIGKYYIILIFFIAVISFLFSEFIIQLVGKEYYASIPVFKYLCFVILIGGYNYYYGMLGLVNIGKDKDFTRYVWISGVLGVFSSIFLSYILNEIGAAISVVIAEICLLFLISNSIIKFQKQFRPESK